MPFLAYLAVLAIAAAGMALGLDIMTRPDVKPSKHTVQASRVAPDPVRQIPIGRAGDPDNKLSPVYPAAPGKDLPVADAASTQKPAETTGSGGSAAIASARDDATSRTDGAQQTAGVQNASVTAAPATRVPPAAQTGVIASAAPSCNVQACSAAYKSFRASDCTYQPFSGERRVCDNPAGGGEQMASQPPQQSQPQQRFRRATASATAPGGDELDEVVRTVRRLPPPSMLDDDDGQLGSGGSIVVIERPDGSHYGLQRRWIRER